MSPETWAWRAGDMDVVQRDVAEFNDVFADARAAKVQFSRGAGVVHLMHGEKPVSLEQASEISLLPVLSP